MTLLFLCSSLFATGQTLSLSNWYALSSYKVTDADECGTVAMVNAYFNNWSPAQFQILKDGVPMGQSELVSKISAIYYEGNGDEPAWRCSAGSSQSWNYTFYINMRVFPYEIVGTIPTDSFYTAKASISSGSSIITSPTEEFTLSGVGCSSVDSASYSYQWMKSTDRGDTWSDIRNATSQEYTSTLSKDSTLFALKSVITYDEVNPDNDSVVSVSREVVSAPILISFKKPEVHFSAKEGEESHRFNDLEFEVREGGTVSLSAITESFEGTPTFTLQYKSLERASEKIEWSDLKKMTNGTLNEFSPTVSAEYRVRVTGTSKYSGKKDTAYSTEIIAIRKIYLVDTDKFSSEYLWNDDFGSFSSARTYVDALGHEYKNSIVDSASGKTATIEGYWAPDPFNYVKEHQYGAFDPNFINNTRDWCSKYRLEDGYYIITNNPYKGDGKKNYADRDYWEAEDHTADDKDGAMLFVNCKAGLEGAMIYERKMSLNCELSKSKGVWVIFNAFINNAVYKEGSETPVNVRMEIIDPDGKVVYSIASGDIHQRKGSLARDSWANLSFRFLAEAQDYTFRLYNNAPGGANWGNDILLDDISVTLCYPRVKLVTRDRAHSSYHAACLNDKFELVAYNEEGLETYIGEPKYLFQYRNDATDNKWKNYGSITKDSVIEVTATEELKGNTSFRVIVASDKSVVTALGEGKEVDLSCTTVYTIDDQMVVYVSKPYEMVLNTTPVICLGEDSAMAVATPDLSFIHPSLYYWYYDGKLVDTTRTDTFYYVRGMADGLFEEAETYSFEVRAIDGGCIKSLSDKKSWENTNISSVRVRPHGKLDLQLVSSDNLSLGEAVKFDIDLDGYDGDSLVWHEESAKKQVEFMSEKATSWQFVPTQNGELSYYISSKEGYGCVDPSDKVVVNVDLVIPNLITPHNDGKEELNNTFLLGRGLRVEIFNRYHQLIFEGDNGWDATYKGDVAEPGTYYYRVFMPNGEIRKGTLEVGKFK